MGFRSQVALAAVAIVGAVSVFVGPSARAETPLERGTYLVRGIAACGNCHTPKDAGGMPRADMELAGGREFDLPVGKPIAPNITPDMETGIGAWTDAQIIAAIREGKRPDGTIIGPPMPIELYRGMSDGDVEAIVAYLRTVKQANHKVGKSVYKIPLPSAYGPPVTKVAEVSRDDKLAYGAYLAGPVGHCIECHTPFKAQGVLDMSKVGAGGRELEAFSPDGGSAIVISANITSDRESGLGLWSDGEIKTAIRLGESKDGRELVRTMPFDWYAQISEADLDSIVVYLRSLKPVATSR
jgi:mono/diheme cytochrome c family protein